MFDHGSFRVGIALALVFAGLSEASPAASPPDEPLRVASLNVGLGDFGMDLQSWRERARTVANLVQQLDLDVLALQEMWSIDWEECDPAFQEYLRSFGITSSHSKPVLLQRQLPQNYTVVSELIPSEDRRRVVEGLLWGLSVVTRFDVVSSEHRRLSLDDGDRYPRIVQRVQVRKNGTTPGINIFNVHLSAESHRSRLASALEVLRYARSGATETTIVAGDLNSGPDDGPLHVLLGAFQDFWSIAETKRVFFGTATANATGSLFRLAENGRIDYVLGKSPGTVRVCEYRFDDLKPVALSDHPLVTCVVDQEM